MALAGRLLAAGAGRGVRAPPRVLDSSAQAAPGQCVPSGP